MIVDDQVHILLVGQNVLLVTGLYVKLITVKDIIQRIIAFLLIALYASDELQDIIGLHETFQIKETPKLWEMVDEQAFDYDNGRRLENELPGLGQNIIESVFLYTHLISCPEAVKINNKALYINGFGSVKIPHPSLVDLLLFPRLVVIVQGKDAKLLFGELVTQFSDETGLP